MARYKTFDSTGIAPNGRLYAGDLNAIQDFLAKASDFAQTVDVGALRVGDSSIQLLKFGTAEARVSAALRTDGILRGLGGIGYPSFTTAGRDAIALGSRPTGLAIFNTTTSRIEVNIGSDATPVWAGTADPIPGVMAPYAYGEAGVPGGWALCYGQPVLKSANPILNARASADGYPHGSDALNIFLPDMRGRAAVGKDNMGGAAAGRVGVGNNGQTLGGTQGEDRHINIMTEIPSHAHAGSSVTAAGALGGSTSPVGDHAHPPYLGGGGIYANYCLTDGTSFNHTAGGNTKVNTTGVVPTTGDAGAHSHTISVNGHGHGLTIGPEGGSGGVTQSHQNMPPFMVMNWIIRLG